MNILMKKKKKKVARGEAGVNVAYNLNAKIKMKDWRDKVAYYSTAVNSPVAFLERK